jgi:predicted PurR-regulated permease PerM
VTRLVIRPTRTIGGQGLGSLASGLIVATLIILFLYMGREILEPLVIAALLGFILAPLIRRLRGWSLWRVPSVILTVLFAITVIAALGSTIAFQVAQLAEDLPKYETNLRAKIRTLGGGALTSSALDRASGTLKDLQNELSKSGRRQPQRGARSRSW